MHTNNQYKFFYKETINENDYKELNNLLEICQKASPVNVKLELDYKLSLGKSNHKSKIKTEFFCYVEEVLVSYLGICNFGSGFNELTGLTHPDWRRQNIFKELLHRAITEMKKENCQKVLLLSDHNSASGTAFIKSMGGAYSFSEYGMILHCQQSESKNHLVHIEKAQAGDRETIGRMEHLFFSNQSDEKNDLDEMNDSLRLDSTYLIYKGSDIIGKICVDISGAYGFIYGFGIVNEHRGLGYGTQALQETIALLHGNGITDIGLDVAAANDRALHIYTNIGFVKQSVMDYYELNIS